MAARSPKLKSLASAGRTEPSFQSLVQQLDARSGGIHDPVIKYFVVAIGLSASAALAETQGTKASRADEMFIKEAMQGDLAEVNVGKLAQEKAQSEGVKDFGKMLEEDHGEHSQKVQGKAQELGVTPH